MHTDVTTTYLGMELRSPLIVGACPLTLKPETVRELGIAGAGAVVLPSLLEEQIVRRTIDIGGHTSAAERRVEATGSAEREDDYNGGVEAYLRCISLLKQHTGVPIIANLNGCTDGHWLDVVREMESSGVDAVELSMHSDVSDPALGADAVEQPMLSAVERISDDVSVPVAVKLLPFYTSLPNLAWRLAEAGASGVVLFGREPLWEVSEGEMIASSHWQLSTACQLQTTLSGLIRVRTGGPNLSIAASGGITTAKDVVHVVTAGADVAMVTSEIYRTGPDAIAHILEGLTNYLIRNGIPSFNEFVAQRKAAAARQTRKSQIQPMLTQQQFRDPHPQLSRQHGDQWGHRARE